MMVFRFRIHHIYTDKLTINHNLNEEVRVGKIITLNVDK